MKTFHFIKIDTDILLVSRSIMEVNFNIPKFFIKEVFCKEEEIFAENKGTVLFDLKEVEKVINENEDVFVYDPEKSPYFEEGKIYLQKKNSSTPATNSNEFYRKKIAEYIIRDLYDEAVNKIIETFR